MSTTGTYVYASINPASVAALRRWVSQTYPLSTVAMLPDPHITVLYSRAPCDCSDLQDMSIGPYAQIRGFDFFDSPNKGKCLVCLMQAPQLENLHRKLVTERGASHDHDEYRPHLTLGYNVDFELADLKNVRLAATPVVFLDQIKVEPLRP